MAKKTSKKATKKKAAKRKIKGFKKETLRTEEQKKRKLHKEIERLEKAEKKASDAWVRDYRKALYVIDRIVLIVRKLAPTKTAIKLCDRYDKWRSGGNISHTKKRNEAREQKKAKQDELLKSMVAIEMFVEHAASINREQSTIVDAVFALNQSVIDAQNALDEYLKQNVYLLLLNEDGTRGTQQKIEHGNKKKKVVAIVNRLNLLDPFHAKKAKIILDAFFKKFTKTAKVDKKHKAIVEICKGLLIEENGKLKIGPRLNSFLAQDLSSGELPDLMEAQDHIRKAIYSKQSNSYIRLWERNSEDENYKPVGKAT